MRIGILTYHKGGNAGALLQCFALYDYLSKDNEVFVVDYVGDSFKWLNKPKKYAALKVYYGSKRKLYKMMRNRQHEYDSFIKKNLTTMEAKKAKDLDILVVGSDQLLNFEINNYDINYIFPMFYKGRKVMYGGSFGQSLFLNNYQYYLLNQYLPRYNALSFREEQAVSFVKKYFNCQAELVCDPTFLLDKTRYQNLLKHYTNANNYQDRFIFVYYPNSIAIEKALTLSKKNNLPIYVIASGQLIAPSNQYTIIYDDSPLDFLYLISHSDINIVGSFHGVCFSLIFNKTFSFYNNNVIAVERLESLKKWISLPDCINGASNADSLHFDWDKINFEINIFANKSKEWIKYNVK